VPKRSKHPLPTVKSGVNPIQFQTQKSVVKISASSQVNGKIQSPSLCSNKLNRTIQSKSVTYMDPWKYQRWDQVPGMNKHLLPTGYTRRLPSFMIMNAELSAVKFSVPSTV
jgi:hypothetical protein